MPRTQRLLPAVALVVSAACTAGSQGTATAPVEVTTTTTGATSTGPATTPTTAETGTTSTTEAMPPADAEGATSIQGDVDGDGQLDTVHAYTSAAGFRTLAVERTGDGLVSVQLPSPPDTPPELAGAVDAGGEGRVILVQLDTGATTSFVVPYRLAGRELVQVGDADDELVSFTIGADTLSREGVQCRTLEELGPVIVSREAVSREGGAFTVTETILHLEDGLLVRAADPEQYELDATADAEALDAIATVDCPSG